MRRSAFEHLAKVPSVAYARKRHFCGTAQLIPMGCTNQVRAHLLFCSLPAAGAGVAASGVDLRLVREVPARETFSLSGSESCSQSCQLFRSGLIGRDYLKILKREGSLTEGDCKIPGSPFKAKRELRSKKRTVNF